MTKLNLRKSLDLQQLFIMLALNQIKSASVESVFFDYLMDAIYMDIRQNGMINYGMPKQKSKEDNNMTFKLFEVAKFRVKAEHLETPMFQMFMSLAKRYPIDLKVSQVFFLCLE